MLRDTDEFGSGRPDHWCRACKQPIETGQSAVTITFSQDPHGFKGLSGEYHKDCSRTFASLAQAINTLSRRGF